MSNVIVTDILWQDGIPSKFGDRKEVVVPVSSTQNSDQKRFEWEVGNYIEKNFGARPYYFRIHCIEKKNSIKNYLNEQIEQHIKNLKMSKNPKRFATNT